MIVAAGILAGLTLFAVSLIVTFVSFDRPALALVSVAAVAGLLRFSFVRGQM